MSDIPDGYTSEAFIKGVEGMYDDTRISYRRMLHEERYVINGDIAKKGPKEASRLIVSVLCKFIRQWDARSRADQELIPLTFERVRKVEPKLIERLYSIVSGWEAGDVDPNKEATKTDADEDLEAILSGTPGAIAREGNDEKNSVSG